MKSIRYATYLAIALHFIRLFIRRAFTRAMSIPRIFQAKPDTKHYIPTLFTAKVVMFYKLNICPHFLLALECYTREDNEAETLANYLAGHYKNFKETICIVNSTADIPYTLKESLDPSLRKTIIKDSPIIVKDLTIRAIMKDITEFCRETFHYEPSFNNFRVTVEEIC